MHATQRQRKMIESMNSSVRQAVASKENIDRSSRSMKKCGDSIGIIVHYSKMYLRLIGIQKCNDVAPQNECVAP